jgi:hypothetical protein
MLECGCGGLECLKKAPAATLEHTQMQQITNTAAQMGGADATARQQEG